MENNGQRKSKHLTHGRTRFHGAFSEDEVAFAFDAGLRSKAPEVYSKDLSEYSVIASHV